jgi:hypothetical protein
VGWIVAAVIFAWCRVKTEQAIEEGLDAERTVLEAGASPSTCDVAVVHSILAELADGAGIDWTLPLAGWSKDQMVSFLLIAWQLMKKAEAAREKGMGGILKSDDWAPKGDEIPF